MIMDNFTPLSIDEFDRAFASKTKSEPVNMPLPFDAEPEIISSGRDSLIPEIPVEEKPQADREEPERFFNRQPAQAVEVPAVPEDNIAKPAAPPAGAYDSLIETKPRSINYIEYEGDPEDDEDEPKGRGAGNLAAKIVVIVLLAATLVTFVLGCFVSMFIDNRDVSAGSYTFCTIRNSVLSPKLSQGDMIIVKKCTPDQLTVGRLIAFYSPSYTGCRVHVISSTTQVYADTYNIVTTGYDGETASSANITNADVIGIVAAYVPNVGSVVNFAMNNGILVCVLFALLVVFWGLLLVLIERTKKNRKAQ